MTLIDLKKAIEAQNVPDDFMILLCSDNTFIADQYVEAICGINNLTKTLIKSLQEQTSALALVMEHTDELSVLKTDVFEEALIDYSNLKNTVVICNKIDKKIKPLVEDYIIEVPKLTDWQVKSYINLICPELDEEEVDWLYTATNGDIYKIINEVDKLLLFPRTEQKQMLSELRFSPNSDLYSITIYDLSEAIIRNNKAVLLDYMKHKDFSFDLMSIVGITLKTVKEILMVTQNSGKTATELGMPDWLYKKTARNYKGFPLERLQYLLRFLANVDLKLKSGLIDTSKSAQIDYLITNLII